MGAIFKEVRWWTTTANPQESHSERRIIVALQRFAKSSYPFEDNEGTHPLFRRRVLEAPFDLNEMYNPLLQKVNSACFFARAMVHDYSSLRLCGTRADRWHQSRRHSSVDANAIGQQIGQRRVTTTCFVRPLLWNYQLTRLQYCRRDTSLSTSLLPNAREYIGRVFQIALAKTFV